MSTQQEEHDNTTIQNMTTLLSTPLTTTIAMTQQQQEITFLAGEACLYSVTKRCAVSLGWRLIGEDASDKVKRNCHVIWIDR